MDSWLRRDLLLRINLALAFFSGLLTLWDMIREPSETQAAVVGGLSLPRVLIILIIILILSFVVWLFINSLQRDFWSTRSGEYISKVFAWGVLPSRASRRDS